MKNLISNRNFYLILLGDMVFLVISYICAYLLRFDGYLPPEEIVNIQKTISLVVLIKISVFFLFGLYKGMWRYFSLIDFMNVFKAAILSSMLVILALVYLYNFQGFPRSVFLIDFLLTFLLVGGSRAAIRLILSNGIHTFWNFNSNRDSKRLIIIGAGSAGEKVLREIIDNAGLEYKVVGFLDDDKTKQGKALHGVPVLGRIDQIRKFKPDFDEALIAIPSAKREDMRRILSICEKLGKKIRTMPSLGELIGGKISLKAIREINVEDILGRDEIYLDQSKIDLYLKNKRVLVTGAGGSIGSELVRQIIRFNPQALGLFEFSEFNLFSLDLEIRKTGLASSVHTYLGDIRDRKTVDRVFESFMPDVVFHAAAYKHVPLQEITPWEAVYNNVLGTMNLVDAATRLKVKKFVLVSTDKAVRPSNVMGATKRVAEMIIQAANDNGTAFIAVRFGNVIGSSGSAIPIFQQQIAKGGPVTITHPEMQRYFMSIPEAAQLILQAGAMGEGGEIYILDMGKPVRILDMAKDIIRLHGLEPDKDIPIKFIGLRPGEKLYEELITKGEGIVETSHGKIMVLRGKIGNSDLLKKQIEELLSLACNCDSMQIKEKLREIIPEYKPQLSADI